MKGLKAGKKKDRFRAAAFLALRYRTPPHPHVYERECGTAPVSIEESRLILEALGEVPWDEKIDGVDPWYPVNCLAIKKQHGFKHDLPVANIGLLKAKLPNGWKDVRDDFNHWRSRRGTGYRIQKLVAKPGK